MKPQFTLRCAKLPVDWQSGHICNAADPAIWLPQQTADTIAHYYGHPFGVGYVLTPDDPHWLLDIDHCLQNGQWSPLACDLTARLPGCYVEVSQSGNGLHIVGSGQLPDHTCRNNTEGIELYDRDRMISLTGTHARGDMSCDATAQIAAIAAQYFPPSEQRDTAHWTTEPVAGYTASLSDNELLVVACRRPEFRALWSNPDEGDRSEGDLALCSHLAYYTGGDCERIERLFSLSERVRGKWTGREDYRHRTILKAVSGRDSFYSTTETGLVIGAGSQQHDMIFTELKHNGKPKPVMKNLIDLLDLFKILCRFNQISKQVEINVPGMTAADDNDSRLAAIESLCEQFSYPKSYVANYVRAIAKHSSYNPARDWIESTRWDGVDRFGQLAATLRSEQPETYVKTLLTRWLIGAARAVMDSRGISGCGVLVLQGGQYAGKTRWFWRLLGDQTQLGLGGAVLSPHSRDSVRRCVSHWLVELGELDGTFRHSDMAGLKAFLDLDRDTFRIPYARDDSAYPRQTLFVASVNERNYLIDGTGNRRFWTIEAGAKVDHDHDVDMGQVWAQAMTLARQGEQHWLTQEEFHELTEENEPFRQTDPVEDMFKTIYNLKAPRTRIMTTSEIIAEMGLNLRTGEFMKASSTIARLLRVKGSRKSNGRSVFDMPQPGVRENNGF